MQHPLFLLQHFPLLDDHLLLEQADVLLNTSFLHVLPQAGEVGEGKQAVLASSFARRRIMTRVQATGAAFDSVQPPRHRASPLMALKSGDVIKLHIAAFAPGKKRNPSNIHSQEQEQATPLHFPFLGFVHLSPRSLGICTLPRSRRKQDTQPG